MLYRIISTPRARWWFSPAPRAHFLYTLSDSYINKSEVAAVFTIIVDISHRIFSVILLFAT